MNSSILKYIPKSAKNYLTDILSEERISLIVKKERKTKHGDFRVLKTGECQIFYRLFEWTPLMNNTV